ARRTVQVGHAFDGDLRHGALVYQPKLAHLDQLGPARLGGFQFNFRLSGSAQVRSVAHNAPDRRSKGADKDQLIKSYDSEYQAQHREGAAGKREPRNEIDLATPLDRVGEGLNLILQPQDFFARIGIL